MNGYTLGPPEFVGKVSLRRDLEIIPLTPAQQRAADLKRWREELVYQLQDLLPGVSAARDLEWMTACRDYVAATRAAWAKGLFTHPIGFVFAVSTIYKVKPRHIRGFDPWKENL